MKIKWILLVWAVALCGTVAFAEGRNPPFPAEKLGAYAGAKFCVVGISQTQHQFDWFIDQGYPAQYGIEMVNASYQGCHLTAILDPTAPGHCATYFTDAAAACGDADVYIIKASRCAREGSKCPDFDPNANENARLAWDLENFLTAFRAAVNTSGKDMWFIPRTNGTKCVIHPDPYAYENQQEIAALAAAHADVYEFEDGWIPWGEVTDAHFTNDGKFCHNSDLGNEHIFMRWLRWFDAAVNGVPYTQPDPSPHPGGGEPPSGDPLCSHQADYDGDGLNGPTEEGVPDPVLLEAFPGTDGIDCSTPDSLEDQDPLT